MHKSSVHVLIIQLPTGTHIGEWGFTEPGITAVGHPASLNLATNHGVYVLEDVSGTWQKYVQSE